MPVTRYRDCRTPLRRSGTGCAFVPVRSMLVQSVVDEEEIIFVQSQGCEVHNGVGECVTGGLATRSPGGTRVVQRAGSLRNHLLEVLA